MEHIYAYDEQNLYVNLWVDSVLGDFMLSQETIKPGEIRIKVGRDLNRRLCLRAPGWVCKDRGIYIQINGKNISGNVDNGYIIIPGSCKAGDEILVHFPMDLRVVENDSHSGLVCLAFGQYLLAALSETQEYIRLPELSSIEREDESLNFYAGELRVIPLAQVDKEKYHVYFLR